MEKTTGMKFKGRQRLVAAHEAGHAVQAALTPGYDLVTKARARAATAAAARAWNVLGRVPVLVSVNGVF